MPCEDSSSSSTLKLNKNERFISFELTKACCGTQITSCRDYNKYCRGKSLTEILGIPFPKAADDLHVTSEEDKFLFFLEWDALRCAAAQYLGIEDEPIDKDRCRIVSIAHEEEGIEIHQVILPPKDMPTIKPCD